MNARRTALRAALKAVGAEGAEVLTTPPRELIQVPGD